jgi:hypothetical protein
MALGSSVLSFATTFATPAAAQPAPGVGDRVLNPPIVSSVGVGQRLLGLPTATIKVNNAATGDRSQISLTWEAWSQSQNVTVVLSVGHQVVMTKSNIALTPVATGGFGSGPQTTLLSAFAYVGNAFVIGLNQVEVEVTTPNGVSGTAVASFVLPGMYSSIPLPPRAEQSVYLIWRLVEMIPQDPPDASTITLSASLAGQKIYPAPTGSTTVNNCYKKYFPDSAHRDQFGWFGDCGEQSFLIPAPDPLNSPAGLALDAAGSPATFTITATVTDTNPAAAFPLAVGPFSVTVSPVVAGMIPQFPVSFATETFLNPEQNRSMKTAVSVHQDGKIVGQTTTHNGIQLTGYRGCVYIALYDENATETDPPYWQMDPPQMFGIDGAFFAGTKDRTDAWSVQITPPVAVNLIGTLVIAQYTCPNDPHRDWNLWSAPLFSLVDEGAKAYALYKGVAGSGNSQNGNNVQGSPAQNSNTSSSSSGQPAGTNPPATH